tara:strand:+ start:3218 stop:3433 length:216 start_codon:yes stop_codon:yes gene_type:complete
MKSRKNIFYSFLAPLIIVIAIIGFLYRDQHMKIYYLPLLITGIYLILEKEFNRRFHKKNILRKIQFFKKNK